MGSQQQFCLRWNNHQINMLGVFDHLLQSETLVDVTLACDGLSLKAHKVVLSACSPFFQHIFLENPCKHPVIILKDVKFTDLRALVDFMYRGEVNVSQDQLSALLKTAEALKVKGLAEVTGGAAGSDGSAGDSAMTTTTLPTSSLATPQAEESPPTQPPPPPLRMSDTGQLSPPAKRKKARLRRRSGSSTGGFSDQEESPEMQTPLEVVETKVEILEEDYQSSGSGNQTASVRESGEMTVMPSPQATAVPTAEMQIDQSPQHSSEASIPANTMTVFGPGSALDGGVSASIASVAASLSHQSSMSLPSQPTPVPHLPPPQPSGVIASTSGAPSTGQGGAAVPVLSSSRRSFKGKDNLYMAVEAVLRYRMSFRDAARLFGMNHVTVYNYVKSILRSTDGGAAMLGTRQQGNQSPVVPLSTMRALDLRAAILATRRKDNQEIGAPLLSSETGKTTSNMLPVSIAATRPSSTPNPTSATNSTPCKSEL